jgi:adenine phosphoribosyltransferase
MPNTSLSLRLGNTIVWGVDRRTLHSRLIEAFAWLGDRGTESSLADRTGWLRDPRLLAELGAAMAAPFGSAKPNLVAGPVGSGLPLAALTAHHLGVGMAAIEKAARAASDSDRWLTAIAGPDHRDRHLTMAVRAGLLGPGDRVLVVDDWVETGSQLSAIRALVEESGAEYVGAVVVVDALDSAQRRTGLGIRSIIHVRDLRRA